MWTVLFPNWKTYKVYFLRREAEIALNQPKTKPFFLQILKKAPFQRNFFLTFVGQTHPSYFLKLFIPKLGGKNRPKHYLKQLKSLRNLKVPLLDPLFLFWETPQVALFRGEPFYGGIIFPYQEKGFLRAEVFLEDPSWGPLLLKELTEFLFVLHERGLFLRDTKFQNFFYDEEEGFKIFDLDGVRVFSHQLPKGDRLKDLATLAMSLQWIGFHQAKDLIWEAYSHLYPHLKGEDFDRFERLIQRRKERREKKLAST